VKTNIKPLLGAGLYLLVTLGFTHSVAAQTDDRIVFWHALTGQIHAVYPDGSGMTQLTSGGGAWPTWSRNKKYILFNRSTPAGNTTYIMEAVGENNGGRIFPVISDGGNSGLDWFADDSAIVYQGSDGGLWSVAVDADTGEVGTPELLRAGNCYAPACSPDGTKIAFTTPGGPGTLVVIHDLRTGAEVSFGGYGPSFSPDGTRVAYRGTGAVKKGNKITWYPEIFVANVDGTEITQLTSQIWEYINFPKWSPDGTEIAFWHRANGVNSIRKLTLATGRITVVAKNGQTPDWAP